AERVAAAARGAAAAGGTGAAHAGGAKKKNGVGPRPLAQSPAPPAAIATPANAAPTATPAAPDAPRGKGSVTPALSDDRPPASGRGWLIFLLLIGVVGALAFVAM